MTITNGLATLAEFKLFGSARGTTASTDPNDDTVIEDTIEAVSRYIENETGRRFWKNTNDETRYYFPADSYACDIDDLSAAPTSVSVDYSASRSYTTLTATTDFELFPVNALLDGKPYTELVIAPQSSSYFPEIRMGVKVVGKFGFPSVPDEIKTLCLAICLNIWQERSGQSSAGNVTVTASGVVIRPQDVPAWGQQTIASYRKYL